eukprot:CAMPEP_0198527712 /NCGR_PEP_ID=MMETSP1462-20131121/24710_1 /TAXON_ID=1333877 /ORGANISM="Brandtodinium nutriculum, Strain RCC3387" /LENGTH=153 /DNA_ID=CAMNT_0044257523 /DNA_START=152 /DNA_END=613 /DNA_ORIENTATION=+
MFLSRRAKLLDQKEMLGVECRRVFSIAMLAISIASCLFFIVYDLTVVHIWWSSALIYLPCIGLFTLGLVGWLTGRTAFLAMFGVLMMLVDVVLAIYGVFLCFQPAWWWGLVTLAYAAALAPLGIFAITGWQVMQDALLREPPSPGKAEPMGPA